MAGWSIPPAIRWHEGMLLEPQHFQQQAFRTEEMLAYGMACLQPWFWGVRRLEVDRELLLEGQFRVTDLEAVMPDGLAVRHDGKDEDLGLDLSGEAARLAGGAGVRIWLAVPVKRQGAMSCGEDSRLREADWPDMADDNTGDREVRIPRLTPRLSLFAGERPPRKYVSMSLAEVGDEDGSLRLREYMPPSFAVKRGTPLFGLCRDVAAQLRRKAEFLSDRMTVMDENDASLTIDTRLAFHSLLSGIPPLEALLYSGKAHPFHLYLALQAAAGSLASLGGPGLPPRAEYRHEELMACFGETVKFVRGKVEQGVIESYEERRFEREGAVFSLRLKDEIPEKGLLVGVIPRSGRAREETARWMEQCVIGTGKVMDALSDRRVRGAGRRRLSRDSDIVPSPSALLYRIDPDPEYLEQGEMLMIRNTIDPGEERRPMSIILYVKRDPQGAKGGPGL